MTNQLCAWRVQTFYCDVSPLASIKFAEGGEPLPITQISGEA